MNLSFFYLATYIKYTATHMATMTMPTKNTLTSVPFKFTS